MKLLLPHWRFVYAFLFSSCLSANDPVSVVPIMHTAGASHSLTILILGESLLTEGFATICFHLFGEKVMKCNDSYDTWNVIQLIIKDFFISPLTGAVVSYLTCLFIGLVNQRYRQMDTVIQITLQIFCAYFSFYLAEYEFEVSGVFSVVAAGIVFVTFSKKSVLKYDLVESIWFSLEWLASTLLFLFSGVAIVYSGFHHVTWKYDIFVIVSIYVLLTITRFVSVLLIYPLFSFLDYRHHHNLSQLASPPPSSLPMQSSAASISTQETNPSRLTHPNDAHLTTITLTSTITTNLTSNNNNNNTTANNNNNNTSSSPPIASFCNTNEMVFLSVTGIKGAISLILLLGVIEYKNVGYISRDDMQEFLVYGCGVIALNQLFTGTWTYHLLKYLQLLPTDSDEEKIVMRFLNNKIRKELHEMNENALNQVDDSKIFSHINIISKEKEDIKQLQSDITYLTSPQREFNHELYRVLKIKYLESIYSLYLHDIKVGKIERNSYSAQRLLNSIDYIRNDHSAKRVKDWDLIKEIIQMDPHLHFFIVRFLDPFCSYFTEFSFAKYYKYLTEKSKIYILISYISAHRRSIIRLQYYLSINDDDGPAIAARIPEIQALMHQSEQLVSLIFNHLLLSLNFFLFIYLFIYLIKLL